MQFCREYIKDFNATQAAIRAGYSKKTAFTIGSENLKKPYVQACLQELQKKLALESKITLERIEKELSLIAFADMRDYVDISEDGVVTPKLWDGMPEDASRAVAEIKEVRRIMGSGEGGKEIILECRLGYKHWDKLKALELLGKQRGMFRESLDVNIKGDFTERLARAISRVKSAKYSGESMPRK